MQQKFLLCLLMYKVETTQISSTVITTQEATTIPIGSSAGSIKAKLERKKNMRCFHLNQLTCDNLEKVFQLPKLYTLRDGEAIIQQKKGVAKTLFTHNCKVLNSSLIHEFSS